ncbi:MAG: flagellar motor switch protein FliN [candidate division Zixibacteria bacterium]|nr:flagellar motor switch protein FliN [candidate division Zixibacteria bacterium]
MADENDLDQAENTPVEDSGNNQEETPVDATMAADQQVDGESAAEADGEPVAVEDEPAADGVSEEVEAAAEGDSAEEAPAAEPEHQDASEEDAEAEMLAMLEDLPDADGGAAPEDIDFGAANVAEAEFQHLSEPADESEPRNIDLLMDVNLPVSIELGRTKMSISDILALGPGSVVELSKLAGEPVDVMVNFKTVAKGEVVVIDENFGVRITQLMTPEERLRSIADQQ